MMGRFMAKASIIAGFLVVAASFFSAYYPPSDHKAFAFGMFTLLGLAFTGAITATVILSGGDNDG